MDGTTLTLDLDRLGYGGEDGITLGEAIVQEAARIVVNERNLAALVRERLVRITDEEIRARFRPLLDAALDGAIQPTNSFGEAKGPPTTLREQINARALAWLTEPDPEDRLATRGQRRNRIESFIAKEVATALQSDLKDAMDEAHRVVVAGVKEKAAEVIAETIARTVVR